MGILNINKRNIGRKCQEGIVTETRSIYVILLLALGNGVSNKRNFQVVVLAVFYIFSDNTT